MTKHRRLILLALSVGGLLLLIGLWSWANRSAVPAVDAQTLLTQASRTTVVPPSAAQVSHLKISLYQRTNPRAVEPPDPYHKPVLNLYSDRSEMEIWTRGGNSNQQRTTTRDSRSGLLLADRVRNGEQYGDYNVASGYATLVQNYTAPLVSSQQATSYPEVARQAGLTIQGTVISAWGKPAWVVYSQRNPPAAEELEQLTFAALPFQKPYMNDLDLRSIEQTWLVDQAAQQVVSYEEWAVTAAGRVLLQKNEYNPVEFLSFSALSADWLAFPPKGVPVRASGSPNSDAPPNKGALTEALTAATFTIFLPDSSKYGLSLTAANFNPQVTPREVWQQSWRFDIEDAARYGLTLQTIYSPGEPDTEQALAMAQGPREQLVPLMRETDPIWTASHAVPLQIAGQAVTAWVATGGSGDTPPRRVVVMAEVANTFLFVVGQSYTEAQTLDIVRSLHPAP